MTRTVALALFVLGCGTKEPVPAVSSTPASSPTAGSCSDRAAQLHKRLHDLAAATPGFLPVARDITAPMSPGARVFDQRGIVVAVAKDGTMSVPAYRFAKLEELRDYLDEKNKQALEKNALGGGSSKELKLALYVWADRDTPAATIASVLATAATTSDHWLPRLVVAGIATTQVDSSVAAKLPAGEPDATRALANQLRTSMGDCKPTIMALATSTSEGLPQRETETLAQDVPAGYAECNCTIPDPRAFEQGMEAWFGAWAPPLGWVDMPKLDATDHQPIGKLVAK